MPEADAGGPYKAIQGVAITLSASGSSDPDADIDPIYEWDLNGDGLFDDATGVNPTKSFNNSEPFTIWLRVTDDSGYSATDDAQVMIQHKPGELSVTPGDGFNSSGLERGPFSPSSTQYTLANIGGTDVDWTASVTGNWMDLSLPGGILRPGASIGITASINSNANSLNPSRYSATVHFSNNTNGLGSTTRPVALEIICHTDLTLENMTVSSEETFSAQNSITAGPNFIITKEADVTFRAGGEIRLAPGFTAEDGSEFHTELTSNPCG